MPPSLENRPELFEHLQHIWTAYTTLDAARQYGYGHPQPLQVSEIAAYARMMRFDQEETLEMTRHMRKMDEIYLNWHVEKRKRESKKRGKT